MIGHLPSFEVEELLYSVLARWSVRRRPHCQRRLMLDIFGRSGSLAVVDLPANLDAFLRILPSGHGLDAAKLIDLYTLYPYYAVFLPSERAKRVRADLQGTGGPRVHARIGLMAGRSQPPKFLRYCPTCDSEDRSQGKGLYWRRLHQLSGVEVCPAHEIFLENGVHTDCNQRPRRGYIDPAAARACVPIRQVDHSNAEHSLLLRLARGTAYLLARGDKLHPVDAGWLHKQYAKILCTRGLATCLGGLKIREIHRRFAANFPAHLLSYFRCELASGWLERLLRKPRVVQSPLCHLLMWDFLGLEPASFLDAKPALFGLAPFPCLNPVCPQRGRLVIHSFQIEHHHDRRAPVAAMSCPVCNYDYRRIGPDLEGERRWQAPDWIVNHGPVWRDHLRRLWSTTDVSLREMARTLNVDAITVKRQANKLGLSFPRQGTWTVTTGQAIYRRKPEVTAIDNTVQSERRKQWFALLRCYQNDGRKDLRSRAPALWTALYRHDRDWLDTNSPSRKVPRLSVERINWKERDTLLCGRVEPVVQTILEVKGPSVRITVTRLARGLESIAPLQKCPQNFPLTMERIRASIESREQFALRRLGHVSEGFQARGTACPRWRLVKAAGLRPDLCALPSVKKAVDLAVRRLAWSRLDSVHTAKVAA